MKKLVLETERLILKNLPPSYASKTLKFYEDNRDFLEPFEPERPSFFYTKHHQKQMLRWDQEGFNGLGMVRLWIFEKNGPDMPIGTIALSNIIRGVFQSCFVGYKLDQKHIQQGYMTEAMLKVIEYAFFEMNLHRIEANIMPHNEPSLKLVRKLGFHEEGTAVKYLKIRGTWEDHIHMVLINEDF